MRFLYRIGADGIFVAHLLLVLVVVFGFLIPSIWYLYMTILVATLLSDVVYGYCILSKWEFNLRKKLDPGVTYNFTWATYYTYKVTNYRISDTFYKKAAIAALMLCIALNVYFKFLF